MNAKGRPDESEGKPSCVGLASPSVWDGQSGKGQSGYDPRPDPGMWWGAARNPASVQLLACRACYLSCLPHEPPYYSSLGRSGSPLPARRNSPSLPPAFPVLEGGRTYRPVLCCNQPESPSPCTSPCCFNLSFFLSTHGLSDFR